MMLEILGLPAHIMFLHAVVAFAPVAGLASIVYALRPPWQRVLEWPVVILAVITAVLTVLTANAGEALEEALEEGGEASELIEAHATQGDRLETVAVIFAVVTILTIAVTGPWVTKRVRWLASARNTPWMVWVLRVLTVLAAVILIYQVVVTGHSGAEAVWSDWRTE
ncbi:DUF2231 domain-containing protein [uncultured Citricoccus sp.]|nr:DUF2231 domain-containing protein [uncultured Citricoccus sp.]HRO31754.1 hypothetical protein [Citricoccus sp.]